MCFFLVVTSLVHSRNEANAIARLTPRSKIRPRSVDVRASDNLSPIKQKWAY